MSACDADKRRVVLVINVERECVVPTDTPQHRSVTCPFELERTGPGVMVVGSSQGHWSGHLVKSYKFRKGLWIGGYSKKIAGYFFEFLGDLIGIGGSWGWVQERGVCKGLWSSKYIHIWMYFELHSPLHTPRSCTHP